MTISPRTDREMLTAEEVHGMSGVPISTLHDWAAKRERGIDAPGTHHIPTEQSPPTLDAPGCQPVDRICAHLRQFQRRGGQRLHAP